MSKLLEFAYCSAEANEMPGPLLHWLDPDWEVKRSKLESVATWHSLPAFTWVDLGKVTAAGDYDKMFASLAGLQKKSHPTCHILISGDAPSSHVHRKMLDEVFGSLNPLSVEVDLQGHPDVLAALAKFSALRNAPEMRALFTGSGAATPEGGALVPNADLRSGSGRLSAKNVAEVFGVTLTELGEWIGRKLAALSKTPDSENIQPLLAPLADIAFYRETLGDDETFRKWLRTDHELLDEKSPLYWIRAGRIQQIAEFVENALTGQPT